MKRKYIRNIILVVAISFFFAMFSYNYNVLLFKQPKELSDFYINFITISSIIAGFSFTTLSILISISDSEVIRSIRKTEIMSNKNKKLINSIVYCSSSIFVALLYIIGVDKFLIQIILVFFKKDKLLYYIFDEILYISCIIFLLIGLLYFLKSIQEISRLLGKIYENESDLTTEKKNKINQELRNKQV